MNKGGENYYALFKVGYSKRMPLHFLLMCECYVCCVEKKLKSDLF
ncbi:MAG: hypothetical protein ACI8P3_003504 [Saprospiraceae bacterium]|jgi:hypothetical protein